MNRIPEPELMADEAQALAYANADFAQAHESYVRLFDEIFPDRPRSATVLDLGCGAADVTLRFARANPGYTFHAVDGSSAMLQCAAKALARHGELASRIKLIEGYIPGAPIPLTSYDAILSNNFLHHLHSPRVLWESIRHYSKTRTLVLVTDLFRPADRAAAQALVEKYAGAESDILKRDFFNSLLASFSVEEVNKQLAEAKLDSLQVRVISDRHLIVWGCMNES
jgi:SAM-dependent methyltransferase